MYECKKSSSKHGVESRITCLEQQKSFCDIVHLLFSQPSLIGPIPWGHSGPLSRDVVVVVVDVDIDAQAACDATVATPGEW